MAARGSLSQGHYRYASNEPSLIFYAKYFLSTDRRSVGRDFEIGYSVAEKVRMEPIVERLEQTFHIP